jgi:hypothetical protein
VPGTVRNILASSISLLGAETDSISLFPSQENSSWISGCISNPVQPECGCKNKIWSIQIKQKYVNFLSLFLFFFLCVCGTEVWTQSFMWSPDLCLFVPFSFFLAALGFELRASHLLGSVTRHSYCLSHSTNPFLMMGFFKIGSHKLFCWL